MRSTIILLAAAAASGANATWLRWSVNRDPVWAAQETGHISESETTGWTPIPTPAPGVRSEGEMVLDLLRRAKTSETEWTNSNTCGWFSGVSSAPFVCGNNFTCETNTDHVVACVSATFSPFYSACLDYSAFKAGSCRSLDAATGCCQSEAEPACGTYLWTGSPERSMYKCFETASILTMLDVPQFVVDASLFSKTHTTPTPTATDAGTATDDSSSPGNTEGSDPGTGAGWGSSGSDGSNGNSGSDGASGDSSGGSGSGSGSDTGSNNTPIIVGSVVGGVAGLLLLLLLLLCLTRKAKGKLGLSYTRNKNNKQKAHSTNAYHTTHLAVPASKGRGSTGSSAMSTVAIPSQQSQHHYYHPQATQVQPQQYQQQAPPPQYQTGGQQPVTMAYTVNQGATHTSHPSYSSTTSNTYATIPSNAASGAAPNYVVAGVIPHSNSKQQYQQPQAQAQYQQQPQQQQQGGMSQMQPVNHIHVYYAAPAQNTAAQGASYPAATTTAQQTPATNTYSTSTRDSGGSVPDALGLYTQYQDHGPGYRQSF
ncbi:hypothetical protein F5Y08DRAFT_59978 [Xylaria arbuscula]|nr:hypothetical protein F5Y08DRAFT_59978 [Xylaria arbuscula]